MAGPDDILAPARILEVIQQSVRGDGQTEATIQNAYEVVALVGHACMLSVGYRLVGLGEEHTIGLSILCARETYIHDALTLTIETDATVLPKEWNSHNTYAFRYKHSRSSEEYLLKINRLGNNAIVMGLAGNDKATSFDLPVNEFISSSALPLQLTPFATNKLTDTFISQTRFEDLISLYKLHVIQKFKPSELSQEDSDETRQERQSRLPEGPPRHDPLRDRQAPPPARPYPFDDPLAAAPRRPVPTGDFAPPGFEDEFEMNQPPRGFAPPYQGTGQPGIGDRDLYPPGLGPRDPLRGTFGPGRGGGGMHPTFDDPLFGGQRGGGQNPRAPPGSRYDPVGPWDTPPTGRGQGPSGGGFGPGGFGGGFGGGDII
jgi:hypothetical protein